MMTKSENLFSTLWRIYILCKYFITIREASKITGMLMDLDPETRLKLLTGSPKDLQNIIRAAYSQLNQN